MTFSGFNSHTNPLFIDLKLLKVRDIIKSQQLKIMYELFSNVLHSSFDLNRDIHTTYLIMYYLMIFIVHLILVEICIQHT